MSQFWQEVKKIKQLLPAFLLIFALSSCDDGCVAPDEFDQENTTIESYPEHDGVSGTYDDEVGGQTANWHETDLRSNGKKFLIKISGAWTAWGGQSATNSSLAALSECNLCAKRDYRMGNPSTTTLQSSLNCICFDGQKSEPEIRPDGLPDPKVKCLTKEEQDDPTKCSCTNFLPYMEGSNSPPYTNAMDYGVYYFPLNFYDKYGKKKIAQKQTECKFTRGLGAYIGLFGNRTNKHEGSIRAYHLFSTLTGCDIMRDSNKKCTTSIQNVAKGGCGAENQSYDASYVFFKSKNDKIFIKDDSNNNGDNDPKESIAQNDKPHDINEDVKVTIFDRYHYDNYGKYHLSFLSGVGNAKDRGLLEFMVDLVESSVLGRTKEDGTRQVGIVEFMYKAIVKDTGFAFALKMALSLYIAFYGTAYTLGLAQINQKELMSRVLKIGIVILFTSPSSWVFYNNIVVGLFKDSMNEVVQMTMDISDTNISKTSDILVTQMDRNNGIGEATRFSYVDKIIKKLLSNGTSKKILGLFFTAKDSSAGGDFRFLFALIYVPVIYGLILFFIWTMLSVATVYLINVLKILFALSLGPIFMCFMLFSKTQDMFKKWIAFMGARSLEIVFLFIILYNFLELINRAFTDMLFFSACTNVYNVGLFSIKVIQSCVDRDLTEWMSQFLKVGGLIYFTTIMVGLIDQIISKLITIGGVAPSGDAAKGESQLSQGMAMANSMMKEAFDTAKEYGSRAAHAAGVPLAAGLGALMNKAGEAIPFRGPRGLLRDKMINNKISKYQKEAKKLGLLGAKADAFIRKNVHESLMSKSNRSPTKDSKGNYIKEKEGKYLKEGQANGLKDDALKEYIKNRTDSAAMAVDMLGVTSDSINNRLDKVLITDLLESIIDQQKKILEASSGSHGEVARKQLEKETSDAMKNHAVSISDMDLRKLMDKKSTQRLLDRKSRRHDQKNADKNLKTEQEEDAYLEYLYNEGIKERGQSLATKGLRGLGKTIKRARFAGKTLSADEAAERFVERVAFNKALKNGKSEEDARKEGRDAKDGTKVQDRQKEAIARNDKRREDIKKAATADALAATAEEMIARSPDKAVNISRAHEEILSAQAKSENLQARSPLAKLMMIEADVKLQTADLSLKASSPFLTTAVAAKDSTNQAELDKLTIEKRSTDSMLRVANFAKAMKAAELKTLSPTDPASISKIAAIETEISLLDNDIKGYATKSGTLDGSMKTFT